MSSQGDFPFDSFGLGIFEIHIDATDAYGATTRESRRVTVTDDDILPPAITLSGSIGVEGDKADQKMCWSVDDPSGASVEAQLKKNGAVILNSAEVEGCFDFNQHGVGRFELSVGAVDLDADWIGDDMNSSATRSVIVFDAGVDQKADEGGSVELSADATLGLNYVWDFGD
ncbi:MAG: hypothetical protein KDB27_27775, partial [Planctomycetales bacterium]|nr:hypothetical protein [Planctomycetales bacterium]